jgi:hypothetical protein
MHESNWHRLSRRNAAAVCAVLAAAIVAAIVLLTSGGAARASTPSPYAAYPALSSTEPSGLALSTSSGSASVTNVPATGPAFPATTPTGAPESWPVADSIRKLPVIVAGRSAWIAESTDGGICVLEARTQPAEGHDPLGVSCTEPGKLTTGAHIETIITGSNDVVIIGVAPSNVSAVEVTLTDGSTKQVPVNDDAWALETEAHVQATSNVTGG